jgi:GNAT superfamily N-acetyltransferase
VLDLRPTPLDHPDSVRLTVELQMYYTRIYGDGDVTSIDPREFAAPHGHFVVGYVAGTAVACGGWRRRDSAHDPVLRAGDAELKRMYVLEGHRGRGYASAVLAELERTAAEAGRLRVVLETGVQQPDAIALYTRAGYEPIPKYGVYRDSPSSRCYAKPLRHRADLRSSAPCGGIATGSE